MASKVNLDSLMPQSTILRQEREQKRQPKDIMGKFSKFLEESLSKVNNLSNESHTLTQKLVTGEIDNIHDVMIAAQKAGVVLDLAMEIRNKAVQAYDKIMTIR